MGLFSKLFGGRGDTAPQTIEAEPEPIKTEVNVDQLRRDANGMVAVYQGLLEANKNEGIEDRGQVAKIEKSHRLTSELADGLEAARGGDVNMIGDPAEIANNMLAEFDSTLDSVIAVLDVREMDVEDHSRRCASYAESIARIMKLPDDEIASIKRGVLLHDLGKLSIPNSVLRKPGKLSPDEWTMIRDHSLSGWKLLEGVSLLDNARRVTLEHHEAFWGGGYPGGMAGEEIYVGARIMAVVDAFDAITSRRSYKEAAPPSIAREKLPTEAGELLCPDVLEAFVASYEDLCEVGNLQP